MTIAVFGGSFDPPHVAHLLAVEYVLSVGVAERVIVVPVFEHAFHKKLTSFERRVLMCEHAFAHDPRVLVSSLESMLPRPSFTLNTLEALAEEYPGEQFRLVIGADVLGELKHWHQFEKVERLAPPFVLGRSGVFEANAPPAVLPQISSSQIRGWCRDTSEENIRLIESFVPRAVREMIFELGIYE